MSRNLSRIFTYLFFIYAVIFNYVHADNKQIMTSHVQKIVLGSGCFWGAEKNYEALEGVIDAVSGYSDGYGLEPTYNEITKLKNKFNSNNYAEVVEVTYNTNIISTEMLLKYYFESHDPTQLNKQGNDIGTQYRSIILYSNKQQNKVAEKTISTYQKLLTASNFGKITTQVKPLSKFYKAETYHQNYIKKNPNGYCPDHSTGIKFNIIKTSDKLDNHNLKMGKYIVIIESEGYCAYCEKLKSETLNGYSGTIPLAFRLASQLNQLKINSPTWATPTIIFLQDGVEIFGHQGYMSTRDFYRALGYFKLGESDAYKVAFEDATDNRFCKEYDMFKNTPDGVFVDKISGVALFDTRDRFNSSSGWLSFTKPIDGAIYSKIDNSYGMKRIEIRSAVSDIHLGHMFDDGPNGQPRYCINATVLEFKKRAEYKVL